MLHGISKLVEEELSKLILKAQITSSGAVKLGKYVVCDGHADSVVRVITHAHSDHIIDLNKSIRSIPLIAMTPPTHDILRELGYIIPPEKCIRLDYNVPFEIVDEVFELYESKHIYGSAQVLVEDYEGYRLVYTGDFKLPGTPIIECDILVIEATYGSPKHIRPFKSEIEVILGNFIRSILSKGPIHIYGYHGKLQEVMEILRREGVVAPFIATDKVYRITKALVKYGLDIGEIYHIESLEAKEIMKTNWYILFDHIGSKSTTYNIRCSNVYKIFLSGWEFSKPIRKLSERSYIIALSDHADFEQLIEYVRNAKPKLVITDAYRESSAIELANEIRRKLGIYAIPLPQS